MRLSNILFYCLLSDDDVKYRNCTLNGFSLLMKSFPYIDDDVDDKISEFDFIWFKAASLLILLYQIGPE